MTIAKEAWPFVVPFMLGAVGAAVLDRPALALGFALVGMAVLAFFRIPERVFRGDPSLVLAPANGRVTGIDVVSDPSLGPGPHTRVTTFLSVFDVHVQRAPASGTVVSTSFAPGKKVAAFRPEAGDVNESRTTVIQLRSGETVAVRQIAGLVARRVVGYLEKNDTVERGDLLGIIKFGSRVDLFLPERYDVLVSVGQRVQEGATPIAVPGD